VLIPTPEMDFERQSCDLPTLLGGLGVTVPFNPVLAVYCPKAGSFGRTASEYFDNAPCLHFSFGPPRQTGAPTDCSEVPSPFPPFLDHSEVSYQRLPASQVFSLPQERQLFEGLPGHPGSVLLDDVFHFFPFPIAVATFFRQLTSLNRCPCYGGLDR